MRCKCVTSMSDWLRPKYEALSLKGDIALLEIAPEWIALALSVIGLGVSVYSVVYATSGGPPIVEVIPEWTEYDGVLVYLKVQNPTKRVLYLERARIKKPKGLDLDIHPTGESSKGSAQRALHQQSAGDGNNGFRTLFAGVPAGSTIEFILTFGGEPEGFEIDLLWSKSHPWYLRWILPGTVRISSVGLKERMDAADTVTRAIPST